MFEMSVKRALACCLLAGAVLLRGVMAEDAAPAPVKLENKDVSAYLLIQDLKKSIAGIEKVIAQVAPPGQYQPGMIAKSIGDNFGDPQLANLGAKPIVVTLFKAPEGYGPQMGPPPFALFIPVLAADPTEITLQQVGMKTFFADGVLIASLTDEALAKGKAARPDYNKISGTTIPSDARLYVGVSALLETFGKKLKENLTQSRELAVSAVDTFKDAEQFKKLNMKPELAQQLIHLVFNGVEGFLAQSEAIQIDLSLKPEGVLLEETYAAKPGTLAAEYFSGTAPAVNGNTQSFLTKGFMMAYVNMDSKAQAAAIRKTVDAIAADPKTAELAKNDLVAKTLSNLGVAGGESLVSVGAGETGLDVTAAATVLDEAKFLEMQASALDAFGKDGMVSKMYAAQGVNFEMSFDKAVRQHAGVLVNRMNIKLDMPVKPGMPKEMADNMKKLIPQFEMALIKGYNLTATTPAKLDAMIDKVAKGDFSPSGVTLKSVTAFGPGKVMYFDYDMLGYMKFIMNLMNPPGAAAFGQMKDVDPMLISYGTSKGCGKMQLLLPYTPVIEMMKTINAMQNGMVPKKPETEKGTF